MPSKKYRKISWKWANWKIRRFLWSNLKKTKRRGKKWRKAHSLVCSLLRKKMALSMNIRKLPQRRFSSNILSSCMPPFGANEIFRIFAETAFVTELQTKKNAQFLAIFQFLMRLENFLLRNFCIFWTWYPHQTIRIQEKKILSLFESRNFGARVVFCFKYTVVLRLHGLSLC